MSVHGANRLGDNSLLTLLYSVARPFTPCKTLSEMAPTRDASESDLEASMTRFNRWENSEKGKGEDQYKLRRLAECMRLNFSVFREGEAMAEGLKELSEIRERLKHAHDDKATSIPSV